VEGREGGYSHELMCFTLFSHRTLDKEGALPVFSLPALIHKITLFAIVLSGQCSLGSATSEREALHATNGQWYHCLLVFFFFFPYSVLSGTFPESKCSTHLTQGKVPPLGESAPLASKKSVYEIPSCSVLLLLYLFMAWFPYCFHSFLRFPVHCLPDLGGVPCWEENRSTPPMTSTTVHVLLSLHSALVIFFFQDPLLT